MAKLMTVSDDWLAKDEILSNLETLVDSWKDFGKYQLGLKVPKK
jgi:hypothetical protein